VAHGLSRRSRFAEAVDWTGGTIRAEGRLTVQGAELISGVAEALHRGGHARVIVDLRRIHGADDDALDVRRALATGLRAHAGELVVLPQPVTHVDPSDVADGGDAACWANRVCPTCGRLADQAPPTRCSACGEPVDGD
jgi:hypothetical protein